MLIGCLYDSRKDVYYSQFSIEIHFPQLIQCRNRFSTNSAPTLWGNHSSILSIWARIRCLCNVCVILLIVIAYTNLLICCFRYSASHLRYTWFQSNQIFWISFRLKIICSFWILRTHLNFSQTAYTTDCPHRQSFLVVE